MRMFHYYVIVSAVVVPALLVTAWLGISGALENHFRLALVTAIATVGAHSLLILFMILTGRILREAVRSRELSREFLDELNVFFARKQAYPAAVFSAMSIVAAGVLAYAQPALGLPAWTHMVAGLLALVYNLWAFPLELGALRENQLLVDRAAAELDAIDRELEARGELPVDEPVRPAAIARGAAIIAVSAWMPYFYWVVVEGRGDFSKVSLHPWVEVSVVAFLIWRLARSEVAAEALAGASTPRE